MNKCTCFLSVFRKQKKISQQDFCDLLNISRKTLSGIENGKNTDLFLALKIAAFFDKKIEDIWKLML